MALLDRLLSVGPIRKGVWRLWYPFVTRKLRNEDILFLNFAFETEPHVGLELAPEDEPNRGCIQLYHQVASQVDLTGKDVLEVSCERLPEWETAIAEALLQLPQRRGDHQRKVSNRGRPIRDRGPSGPAAGQVRRPLAQAL